MSFSPVYMYMACIMLILHELYTAYCVHLVFWRTTSQVDEEGDNNHFEFFPLDIIEHSQRYTIAHIIARQAFVAPFKNEKSLCIIWDATKFAYRFLLPGHLLRANRRYTCHIQPNASPFARASGASGPCATSVLVAPLRLER